MIFRVLCIFIFSLSLSCQRKITNSGNGPYTSETAINLAQDRALSKLSPYQIEQGQRVHKIETLEVISSQAPQKIVSKEWVTEVIEAQDTDSSFEITTLKAVSDADWGKDFIYEFKDVINFQKVSRLAAMDQLNTNAYAVKSLVQKLKENGAVEEKDIDGVAYQNLASREVTLVPPELVKNAKDCKDLKDCKITGDLITYDIVFLISDGTTQTHKVEWLISSQVPFFAGILKQCATTIIPVDSLRVLVKQCREVVDFDK